MGTPKGKAPDVWPFARRLRELRTRYGWSQTELAGRLGVRPNFISRLESGLRRPGYAILYRLVSELGCSPYEVLGIPFGRRAASLNVEAELERERAVLEPRAKPARQGARKTA